MGTAVIRKLFILPLICSLPFTSCRKEHSPPGLHEVHMNSNMYNPYSITVSPGTTVTWTNNENVTHTVTSASSFFSSSDMKKGDTYSYTFTAAGTYNYFCKHHSNMRGIVIVK